MAKVINKKKLLPFSLSLTVLYRVFAMMEPKANEDQRNRLVDIKIMVQYLLRMHKYKSTENGCHCIVT